MLNYFLNVKGLCPDGMFNNAGVCTLCYSLCKTCTGAAVN